VSEANNKVLTSEARRVLIIQNMDKIYDLIIIGAGPAGLTASVYASRYELNHLIVGNLVGGTTATAPMVHNWPSEKAISGLELSQKMAETAKNLGGQILIDEVTDVKKNDVFSVFTRSNKELKAKGLILALGTARRKINLPNEDKFLGHGVSYCATCDGPLFKNKIAAVLGGSDAAAETSLYLSELAQKVYFIYRGPKLRAQEATIEKITNQKKIEIIYNNNIKELKGNQSLEEIILENDYQGKKNLQVDGLFVEIGGLPPQNLIEKLKLETDQIGYIKIKAGCSTNIPGVFAAGDVTNGSNGLKQIITACAEGAIAATSVNHYLQQK